MWIFRSSLRRRSKKLLIKKRACGFFFLFMISIRNDVVNDERMDGHENGIYQARVFLTVELLVLDAITNVYKILRQ